MPYTILFNLKVMYLMLIHADIIKYPIPEILIELRNFILFPCENATLSYIVIFAQIYPRTRHNETKHCSRHFRDNHCVPSVISKDMKGKGQRNDYRKLGCEGAKLRYMKG